MKRSEAIETIYEILADYYECCTDSYLLNVERDKLLGTYDFADDILFRLEKLGMLPPSRFGLHPDYPNNEWEEEE